jgi:RNA 2',3'-cyclic 3'-phosphodiesterase
MARLFIAVWPPEEVIARLTELPRKDQRGVRFVQPESWHVTLRFLGNAHRDEVVAALDGAELPPAHVQLGPGVDVIADRALVVPVDGLGALAAAVTAATSHLGQPPPRRRFVGHLTLARVKPHARMPRALGAFIRAEFDVDEIALVESRLDPHGARYETLQSWPVG